jgi:myo-inositol-1(or 4)-monophosphatase
MNRLDPPGGCINIHPTGLLHVSGLSPYFSHILFGDTRNYITMHWLNAGADTGDIIAQASVEILPEDTGFTCGHRLTEAGAAMFREYWPLVKAGKAPRTKQDESKASTFDFSWSLAQIDWHQSNTQIWNLVRCLTRPQAGAWTMIGGRKMRVWAVQPVEPGQDLPNEGALPGQVLTLTGRGLWVQCGQGQLRITDATLENLPDKTPFDMVARFVWQMQFCLNGRRPNGLDASPRPKKGIASRQLDGFGKCCSSGRTRGGILRSNFGTDLLVEFKGPIDIVTEVDRSAETAIVRLLLQATPSYGFITEEHTVPVAEAGPRWIVDPLDGTVNYTRGVARFCVSIALEYAGQLELGIIYDPLHENLFVAERGKGASLNGSPIRVSRTDTLSRAVVSTGFSYDAWTVEQDNRNEVQFFVKQVMALRATGSAALIWPMSHLEEWMRTGNGLEAYDVAAGILLSAKRRVCRLCRGEIIYSGRILAANPDTTGLSRLSTNSPSAPIADMHRSDVKTPHLTRNQICPSFGVASNHRSRLATAVRRRMR